jgi:hypothetical protein
MAMGKIGIAAASAAAAIGGLFGGSAIANAATGGNASTYTAAAAYTQGTPSGSSDTQVTGDELAKVTAAMKAKDSSVTVTSVRKDPDGSYDVFGTKAGRHVMYDVSADLSSITQNNALKQRNGSQANSSNSTTPSSATT